MTDVRAVAALSFKADLELGQFEHSLPVWSGRGQVGVKVDHVRPEYLVRTHNAQHVLEL